MNAPERKRRLARASGTVLAALLLAVSAGCETPAEKIERRAVLHRVEAARAPVAYSTSSEPYLEGVARVGTDWGGGSPFLVEARTPHLAAYPCTQCHEGSIAQHRKLGRVGERASHWEIEPRHAAEGVMTCSTCHDAQSRMRNLRLLRGEPVAFDHSYRVCAQCHVQQAGDWAGGAHGKRLGGWAPPRLVRGCPGCHDPHRPRIGSRWPALVPNAPRADPRP